MVAGGSHDVAIRLLSSPFFCLAVLVQEKTSFLAVFTSSPYLYI